MYLSTKAKLEEAMFAEKAAHVVSDGPQGSCKLARSLLSHWEESRSATALGRTRIYCPSGNRAGLFSGLWFQSAFNNKGEAIRLLKKSYEDSAPFDSSDSGSRSVDYIASTRFAAIRDSGDLSRASFLASLDREIDNFFAPTEAAQRF